MVFYSKQRARKEDESQTMLDYPHLLANVQAGVRLETPGAAVAALTKLTNHAKILGQHSEKVLKALNSNQAGLKIASDFFESSIGPLLNWAKNPRVKSELFMYRKSATAERFSKLVSIPLEKLILILNSFFKFSDLNKILPITQRRAQIMSIRGLALSCAPNFTRISDINSFSRLHRGLA
jgi:hypothetical protein